MKWYSGKYDRAFKEVMLSENNRDILKALLEKILDVTIEEIEIINVEKLRGNLHLKGQRLDLNLKTNIGKINVEVNSNNENFVYHRNTAYLCDTYSHDILVGEEYNRETMYIQINLSYKLGKSKPALDVYKIMNTKGNTLVDNFVVYLVNMDYYMNLWYTKNTKEINKNIVLVMLGLEKEALIDLSKKNGMVLKYMSELDKVNEEPEFREYMSYEEDQRKIVNTLVSEGTKKGIQQGIKKGEKAKEKEIIDKLLKSGMSKEEISKIMATPLDNTDEEYQNLLFEEPENGIHQEIESIVKALIEDGVSIDKIEKYTKLSSEEILKLTEEISNEKGNDTE